MNGTSEREDKEQAKVKGVQRLRMISDYYKLDDDEDLEMTDLVAVKFRDDKSIEAFWNSWNRVLTRVNTACVQESFIERMFFDQVKVACLERGHCALQPARDWT